MRTTSFLLCLIGSYCLLHQSTASDLASSHADAADTHAADGDDSHAAGQEPIFVVLAPGANEDHGEEDHDSHAAAALSAEGGHDTHAEAGHGGEHVHPHYAILWPVTTLVFGVVIYYILSRYLHFIPYTAAMFILGIGFGLVESFMETDLGGNLNTSVEMWSKIDSHTLLMVFLPGLLFKDAFSLNVHLFAQAFWQCWLMAFPAVLAGTALVAVVAHEILPYDWPW